MQSPSHHQPVDGRGCADQNERRLALGDCNLQRILAQVKDPVRRELSSTCRLPAAVSIVLFLVGTPGTLDSRCGGDGNESAEESRCVEIS